MPVAWVYNKRRSNNSLKMPVSIGWTIEGEKQLSRVLLTLADGVKDWTPAFQETAITLKKIFSDDVFKTQGGVIDEHWSPLSKAYAYQKAKKYPGRGILEKTGTMRDSFMTMWRPDMAAVWNEADYFKYHQSNKPRSKLPRRVMMKLADSQRTLVVKIFHNYFERMVKK